MFVKAFLKLFLSKSTFIFCSFKKCCYFFAKTLDKDLPFCYNVKVPNGRLAQLGEHLPYKQRVTGSSPVLSTKENIEAQASALYKRAQRGNSTERTSGGRSRPWKTERVVRARPSLVLSTREKMRQKALLFSQEKILKEEVDSAW